MSETCYGRILLASHPGLANQDPVVRRLLLRELSDDAELYAEVFVAASRDRDAQVRLEAAQALEGTDSPGGVEALADLLLDTDASVVEAAALSLAEILDPALGPVLLARLTSSQGRPRAALLAAVRRLRLSDALAPALESLFDESAQVRREAVGVLAYLKSDQAALPLADALGREPSAEIRRNLAGALSYAATPEALAALALALSDSDWQVREEAAVSLSKLGQSVSIPPLTSALADAHWEVRLKAAQALGRLRARSALQALIDNLDHPVSNLRKEVVNALGAIGDPAACKALQARAGDKDIEVRKSLARALELLGA